MFQRFVKLGHSSHIIGAIGSALRRPDKFVLSSALATAERISFFMATAAQHPGSYAEQDFDEFKTAKPRRDFGGIQVPHPAHVAETRVAAGTLSAETEVRRSCCEDG